MDDLVPICRLEGDILYRDNYIMVGLVAILKFAVSPVKLDVESVQKFR